MKNIIFLLIIIVSLTSCKKPIVQPTSGIFRGTFEMKNADGELLETSSCTISINDNNEAFALNVDTTSSIPFPCSGFYAILDATKMRFITNSLIDTSASVNHHLYLDTTYNYVFDDVR